MMTHSQLEIELSNALRAYGKVEIEPSLTFYYNNRKYRPDLVFENDATKIKLVIEIKSSQMGFTLHSASYVIGLQKFLENNTDYKMAIIVTTKLTPNLSNYITGKIKLYSLEENTLSEIVPSLIEITK
jgi:hypothetical protein